MNNKNEAGQIEEKIDCIQNREAKQIEYNKIFQKHETDRYTYTHTYIEIYTQ